MTPKELAELLAERIREVVPRGITVSCDLKEALAARRGATEPSSPESAGMLWFSATGHSGPLSSGGSYAPRTLLLRDLGSIEARVTRACWGALDDLKDFVDEATTVPWPGGTVGSPPGALVDGGHVHLWYGDITAPVLRLRSIQLEDPLADPLGE
jgi:hypothetical protein